MRSNPEGAKVEGIAAGGGRGSFFRCFFLSFFQCIPAPESTAGAQQNKGPLFLKTRQKTACCRNVAVKQQLAVVSADTEQRNKCANRMAGQLMCSVHTHGPKAHHNGPLKTCHHGWLGWPQLAGQ